jgi:hypothetical protein
MTDVTTDEGTETDADQVDETEAVDADGGSVAEAGEGAGGDEIDFVERVEPSGPLKDRLLLPLLVPFLCMVAIALYTLNISRVFLAGDSTSALVIASLITIGILVGGAIFSASPRLRTSSLAMVMGLVLVIVVSAGLLSLGPSLNTGEGGGGLLPQPTGPPVATVTVTAGPGLTFDGVKFDKDFPAKAGVVEVDYTGEAGHTLQFRTLGYQGFPLTTSGGPKKGKVTLKPGKYSIYCTIPGHAAAGMEATITVT